MPNGKPHWSIIYTTKNIGNITFVSHFFAQQYVYGIQTSKKLHIVWAHFHVISKIGVERPKVDLWLLRVVNGEGNGTLLQYSCLENPMDGGAWWAAVHGVAKCRTRLSDFTFTFHFHASEKEMATHSSVLAWRIPGTGQPGGLPSMGSHRVRHDWSHLARVVKRQNRKRLQID